MKDDTTRIYILFGKYSFWVALLGLLCYLFLFPQGIYYCFFCGVMAVALAIMGKKGSSEVHAALGIIFGLIDIAMGMLAFYGIYIIYAYLRDPVAGPEMIGFLSDFLSQYGISVETFARVLGS